MRYNRKIALLVLAGLGLATDAAAEQWMVQGSLGQQGQYNDNISLSSTQKDSVFGYLVTPTLQASRKSGALDLGFQGLGDIRRYDNAQWNCDNYNLSSNNDYRASSRSVFSLSGGYASSCSYAQQITDSGLLSANIQAVNYRIAPSWAWQWTALDQVRLTTSYVNTSYNGGGVSTQTTLNTLPSPLNLVGNDTYTASLAESHQWNRDLTLIGSVNFSTIKYAGSNTATPGLGVNTGTNISSQNLYSVLGGGNYVIDRFWSAAVSGGPVWVDTQQSQNSLVSGQGGSLSLGSYGNIGLNYKGELSRFSATLSNAISPSAIGETLQTQSAAADYSYSLTRHMLLNLGGNYSHSQTIGGQQGAIPASQYSRNFYSATTGVAYEFSREWRVMGSYIYRRQEIQQDSVSSGTGASNLVMLSVNYTWDGIRQSQ
jgi:hypothetical protein